MNTAEFQNAIQSFDLRIYKETFRLLKKKRQNFVNHFSVEYIRNMQIDEYVQGKGSRTNNFCYQLERELGGLGLITGSPIFKFGIYFSKKRNKYECTNKWVRATLEESFAALKSELADLIEAGSTNDIQKIRNAPFAPIFVGKILSTYYPEKYLSIFSDTHLDYFIARLNLDNLQNQNLDIFSKRDILVNFKNSNPITAKWPLHAFAHFLYTVYPGNPSQKDLSIESLDSISFITGDYISREDEFHEPKHGKGHYDSDQRHRTELGERGEFVVLQYENARLKSLGSKKKPKQVSAYDDSLGFDIRSYAADDSEIQIEVKSTNSSPKDFRFYLTALELDAARRYGNSYHIYIVFNPNSKRPQIFDIGNPFIGKNQIKLTPVNYRIHLQKI